MNMEAKYRPYPAYKDSGVEWLGDVPKGWEIKILKRVFKVVNGSTPRSTVSNYWDGDISWVTPDDLGEINVPYIATTARSITQDGYNSCGANMATAGCVILSTRAPIGYVAIAGVDLCTNQGCKSLIPLKPLSSKYYYYLLCCAKQKLEAYGQGSTFRELSKTKLENINITLPTSKEQEIIECFLDRETAKIDAFIAKQERLIELLQEKRDALITQAVTKGLDSNVPMKDSGVKWLGEIPAHWRLKPAKYLFQIMNGSTPSSSEPDYWDGDLPWVTPEDLGLLDGFKIRQTRRNITLNGYLSCATNMVPVNSIIVSTRAPIGHIAIAQVELCTNQGCRALIPSKGLDSKYFYHIFSVAKRELQSFGQGSTFRELSKTNLENLLLPKPPLREQELISQTLDKKTSKMDGIVKKTRASIKLLKEYRTALMSAAVTGKIDVRGEVSSA